VSAQALVVLAVAAAAVAAAVAAALPVVVAAAVEARCPPPREAAFPLGVEDGGVTGEGAVCLHHGPAAALLRRRHEAAPHRSVKADRVAANGALLLAAVAAPGRHHPATAAVDGAPRLAAVVAALLPAHHHLAARVDAGADRCRKMMIAGISTRMVVTRDGEVVGVAKGKTRPRLGAAAKAKEAVSAKPAESGLAESGALTRRHRASKVNVSKSRPLYLSLACGICTLLMKLK